MSTNKPSVCVVGSINMDLVMRTPRFPAAGETLMGGPFREHPGGKGANQAVAAARCGASVEMIGCVGGDDFGTTMCDTLRNEGIGVDHVDRIEAIHTGVAQITVEASGENHIVVAPGANYEVRDRHLVESVISGADVLLLQLEIPMPVVMRAAQIAADAGVRVILNTAPAAQLPPGLAKHVDVLVANKNEAAAVSGLPIGTPPGEMAAKLVAQGFKTIVITLSADGAQAWWDSESLTIRAPAVNAVDTVGAGDAFAGALAASLARGDELARAVRQASAAGSLAVTREGAIPSLPRYEEVEALAATIS